MAQRGLPRTRGDRPGDGFEERRDGGAAPHTRGSTRTARRGLVPRAGCPAHAGIDPRVRSCSCRAARLPRTRGDRPVADPPPALPITAAPHTRGSTPVAPPAHHEREGCPAHAGIDPIGVGRAAVRARLPRTRGDRPEIAVVRDDIAGAAPHTRGSTLGRQVHRACSCGCPAHAGIDLKLGPVLLVPHRLPRTRGDRPGVSYLYQPNEVAAPHTRGSTVPPRPRSRPDLGCPAHAGIDPRLRTGSDDRSWLPRTRGDRPVASSTIEAQQMAAPHTRGSTRVARPFLAPSVGCPAHAGIDPCLCSCTTVACRLPRTRGDRPCCGALLGGGRGAAPHTRGSTPPRVRERG